MVINTPHRNVTQLRSRRYSVTELNNVERSRTSPTIQDLDEALLTLPDNQYLHIGNKTFF